MFGSGLFPTEKQFTSALNLAIKGDERLLWVVKAELQYVLENQHLAGNLVRVLKHALYAISIAERGVKKC
jgi:hypothetical protein